MSSLEKEDNSKDIIIEKQSNDNTEKEDNNNQQNKENEEDINKSSSEIEVNITTYSLKITFVGDSSVGKTSIIERFINDKFESELITATVMSNYNCKNLKIDPFTEVNMQIWDTAGQERFKSMIRGYLRDSNGIFIVFDLSNKRSFEDIDSWLDEINNSDVDSNTCVKMLIGNKLDTEKREIDNDTANKFAEENNMKYLDVSAKDGINIVTMFEMMGSECIKILQDLEKSGRKNSQGNLKLEQSGKKEEPKENVKKTKKNIKKNGKCC